MEVVAFYSNTSVTSLWVIPAIYGALQNQLPDWFLVLFLIFILHASKAFTFHLVLVSEH